MSAEDLPAVPEFELWANPHCVKCGGRGAVRVPEIIYGGWRWCDCAIANKKQRLELATPAEPAETEGGGGGRVEP